jgi:MFS family permease
VGLEFWQLMVLVFLRGLLDAPGTTARTALIPELATLAKMPLERATSVGQAIERGSRMLGAPLAGLLIPVLGTANVLWLDAASFAVSAGIVALAITRVGDRPKESAPQAYIQEVLDGLRFVKGQAVIFAMLLILMITNFRDAAFSGVLLPVYAKRVFDDPLSLGILIAFWGGGAVLGGVIFGVIGHRLPRQAAFIGSFVLASLYSWSFALFLPFPVVLVAIAVSGIGAGPLNPIIDTVIFERVPAGIRGRVLGTIMASAWVTMPLGVLIGGLVTEWAGLQPVLFALGATYLATTLSMIFVPALRELSHRIQPEEPAQS